ncbi:MAG TPA: enoyl-CoA hydratase-related protein [Hyphomicrobiaceae bacterium]|nr:enoyl-CoA hydratase-related protein [Hyphomicrobiaceae bacterium]
MTAERTLDTGTEQLLGSVRHGVATLTLNRPEARNALSAQLSPALQRMVAQCGADDSVRALLITGAGSAFCAGGDVKGMGDRRPGADQSPDERFRIMRARHQGVAGALYAVRKPTVAALPGPAAGAGLAIALACDIRVASDTAFVATGYAGVGLSGDYGIAWLLSQAVGPSRARELLLTNQRVPAARAAELGIVHRVVASAALQEEAFALARSLAEGPSVAFRYIKDNLDEAMQLDYPAAIDREAERMLRAQGTEDHKEAVRAFVEKRKPVFRGR